MLFVTGHFGYWELQAMVHALRLQPMAVVARALDNPALNALLERIRSRNLTSFLVTTPDGRLIGLALRSDLE